MSLILVILYIIIIGSSLAVIFFPDLRLSIICKIKYVYTYLKNIIYFKHSNLFKRENYLFIFFIASAVSIPTLLVIAYTKEIKFNLFSFESSDNAYKNTTVARLLAGEQLAPPPSLPPSLFDNVVIEAVPNSSYHSKSTASIFPLPTSIPEEYFIQSRKNMIKSARRYWAELDPEFHQKLLIVLKIMKDNYNYEMVLIEGYRPFERQDELYAKGITKAKGGLSYHQYGLASDCAFRKNNVLIIAASDAWTVKGYKLYGQTAEEVGLTWGGRWKNLDLGHVELRRKNTLGTKKNINNLSLENEDI